MARSIAQPSERSVAVPLVLLGRSFLILVWFSLVYCSAWFERLDLFELVQIAANCRRFEFM
ncbi:hypothetical protein AMR42_08425 [Limnothrix sp. PR1529]|nr:hypothetical protein BCR12_09680 [Limnothrix sp. P13C2]PIB13882.1 hypothetical protein AMR42_08425 [Limnothrix sp. PR1529]